MLKQLKAMDEVKAKKKKIEHSLRTLNRKAKKYMKPYSITREIYKRGYGSLLKTNIWKEAKYLLLEYKILDTSYLECPICHQIVDQNRSVLHHKKYNRRKLFKPAYITFVHYKCHEQIHETRRLPLLPRYVKRQLFFYGIIFLFLILVFLFYQFY